MKCKDILEKYSQLVPFPITPESIAAAGYDVTEYLCRLTNELYLCDDYSEQPRAVQICEMASDLRILQQRKEKIKMQLVSKKAEIRHG